jgi:hypothetical protein
MTPDIVSDSSSRFTIYVPKPNTRINMGKPDPDTPFGYKGLSIQTDSSMFVDVNKEARPPSESRIILLSDGELSAGEITAVIRREFGDRLRHVDYYLGPGARQAYRDGLCDLVVHRLAE